MTLPRSIISDRVGLLGHWAHITSRAAFRKGIASYCGHRNPVEAGTWAGGIVGLKSILGVKKREQALDILQQLSDLGYLSFELDAKTKLLTYRITDYELDYCGAPCVSGAVYTTPGYGFLCIPRSITERLATQKYIFNDADAWLDLWCHTVSMDPHNVFSFFAPVCQYGKTGVFLTLKNWDSAGTGKRPRYGDSCKSIRMSSLCTGCPAPTAVSFSIHPIPAIQESLCPAMSRSPMCLTGSENTPSMLSGMKVSASI